MACCPCDPGGVFLFVLRHEGEPGPHRSGIPDESDSVVVKFGQHADPFCIASPISNNLYIAALVIPIIAMVPALIINFSFILLAILIALVGLLLFRFFVIFTKIACVHCRAQNICPQAKSMGFGSR